MTKLTIEQRKNVPAKQQKQVIQKLLNDKEVISKLTTSEVCLLQEVTKILDKQAKQQVKDLQFKVNISEWETNVKKKYSDKDYDISELVQKIYSNTWHYKNYMLLYKSKAKNETERGIYYDKRKHETVWRFYFRWCLWK